MKKTRFIIVFVAILVALSVIFCACGKKRSENGNKETTTAGNENEVTTSNGSSDEVTTSKGNSNEVTTSKGNADQDTTEDKEETTLAGFVETEVVTMVEITIEE
ncbi:MAG: hypothetical protein E7592_01100 [Ruminococcaceae bacterium]|nr:hypothetical protein [Oscillospiraceae bacterium]